MHDASSPLPAESSGVEPDSGSASKIIGNAEAMEAYLYAHIPLAAAMGVRVREAGIGSTVLEAPLEPNRNHRATAFGGSLSALAILAGWTVVNCVLRARDIAGSIVIQRSRQHFAEPVAEAFRAVCEGPTPAAMARFIEGVERYGKGRIRLRVAIHTADDRHTGTFEGDYVVDASGA